MIEFILFSRKGRTDGNFRSLREAGRLDVVYQCLYLGFFTSGAIRRDVIFHVILGGPPRPPIHLTFNGRYLKNVRTDERSWEDIFRKRLLELAPNIKEMPPAAFWSNSGFTLIRVADKKIIFIPRHDLPVMELIRLVGP